MNDKPSRFVLAVIIILVLASLTTAYTIIKDSPTSIFGSNVEIQGNLSAPNICYSNGTNCNGTILVNGSQSNITILTFNISSYEVLEAQMVYTEDGLSIGYPLGTTLQVGKEMYVVVTNLDSVTLEEGTPVSFIGVTGNREAVRRTNISDHYTSHNFAGLITSANCTTNAKCVVTTYGEVHNLDTNNLTESEVYVDVGLGSKTNTSPIAPYHMIQIGSVLVKNANVGIIYVHPMIGTSLSELDDVDGTPINTTGQILVWNQTRQVWDATTNINDKLQNGSSANFIDLNVNTNISTPTLKSYNENVRDSDTLFEIISDTRGTPQFLVQDGGDSQASFITRSFMVVNQNNTLLNLSQNNKCGDWGFIHIDCNTSTTGADFGVTDDIESKGIIYADEGLRAHTTTSGAYMVLGDLGSVASGSNGYYNATTNIFCDYVSNNLNTSGSWIIIQDESSVYNQAYADVNVIINSSCVEVSNNPSWSTDFSATKWILKPKNTISTIAQKGGFFEYYVGNNERSQFRIRTQNGTGDATLFVKTDSGVDGHSALEVDLDSNGYSANGEKISLGSTKTMQGGSLTILELVGDATNLNYTNGAYIDMQLAGMPVNAGEFNGIQMPSGLTNLITVGSSDTFNKSYSQGTNITTAVTPGGVGNVQVFTNDNDVLYVGSASNFTTISFTLDTVASANVLLTYSYCNSSNVYQTLPILSDTTNGFTESGALSFTNPTNRGTCNIQTSGTPFSDANNYTYIALTRTRNTLATPPILDTIAVSGVITNMFLQEDIMKLNPVNTAPETCNAINLGAIYFDISEDNMCVCKSGGWKVIEDGTACT